MVPKETPSERATTPAREGSASGGFLALQRAVGNRAIGELLRSQHRPASPSAVANGGALTIQRRTEVVPKSDDLKKDAPVELFGSNPYEKTLQTIDLYYSLSATDYGQQLVGLDLILKAITAWEAEEGPVGTAVKAGLFGLSRTDQRRLALKRVKDAVTNEQGQVKTQGHTKAVSEHQEDRAKLLEYLNAALASSETLLHNSADWILNAKKAVLYALTPTGDSYARLKQGNKNPAKDEAWFPKGTKGAAGDIASGAVSYNKDDLADNANVNLDDDGKVTGGWNSPGLIAITRPSKKSKETVWETIRHEVQHDADMNKGRDAGAGIRAASEKVDSAGTNAEKQKAEAVLQTERDLQRYKTEYRAYSYEGSKTYAALDNTVQNKTHEGLPFSERQLQIFTHIYKGYAYTKKGWDNNSPLAGGKTFRQAVSEYWNPDTEGFNKLNSARIDDFYRALDAVGGMAAKTTSETKLRLDVRPVSAKEADPDAPSVKALLKAIEGLHGPEADYIANESRQLQDKIDKHLDGAAKQKVVEELKDMAMWSKLGSISLFD
ncbi:MAG TPA: hypothetical protein VFZ25_01210 [Chloroflexota bacterium]|nr:hypothetical protein [Chloroflexota bacterium]